MSPSKKVEDDLPIRVVRLPKQKSPQTKVKVTPKPRLPGQPTVKQSPKVTRPRPPQLQVSPSPTPSPTPSPSPVASSPSPTPSPSPSVSPEPGEVLAAFSPDGATVTSCSNVQSGCRQIDDTQWRSVAGNLTQEITRRGYSVEPMTDQEDEHGMGIYKIVKPGKPVYYLHFLLTDNGTIYYLDRKLLDREQLEQAIGV